MAAPANAMNYGTVPVLRRSPIHELTLIAHSAPGNSGFKVSRLILDTALWGNPKFLPWATIDEEAVTEQVRVA